MKQEILKNLKNSINIIKYYIYSTEREYFNMPEVSISDYEIYGDEGLQMAMISVRFNTYCEPEFHDFIKDINIIEDKMSKIFDDFAIKKDGKLAKKDEKEKVIYFVGSFLLADLKYNFSDAEIEIELDAMFHH